MDTNSRYSDEKVSLSLDQEFDPLEDFASDENDDQDEEINEYIGPEDTAIMLSQVSSSTSEEEQISHLLRIMAPQRKILLNAIAYCREQQPVSEFNAYIDDLQANRYSVYSAAILGTLLEKAGALTRVTEDGTLAEAIENEPEIVVVDGVEFLETRAPVEVYWLSTQAGLAAVDADKPLERLLEAIESASQFKPIYKRILTLCLAEDGVSIATINAAVDNDPLLQEPRRYATRFVDDLEKHEAIVWEKTWKIADIGLAALAFLADVKDNASTGDSEEV